MKKIKKFRKGREDFEGIKPKKVVSKRKHKRPLNPNEKPRKLSVHNYLEEE